MKINFCIIFKCLRDSIFLPSILFVSLCTPVFAGTNLCATILANSNWQGNTTINNTSTTFSLTDLQGVEYSPGDYYLSGQLTLSSSSFNYPFQNIGGESSQCTINSNGSADISIAAQNNSSDVTIIINNDNIEPSSPQTLPMQGWLTLAGNEYYVPPFSLAINS